MSRKELTYGITGLIVIVVMTGIYAYETRLNKRVVPNDISPPPPVKYAYTPPPVKYAYTPSEATVKVSAWFGNQRSYGKGIIVRCNGQMFVLTSSMIFNKNIDWITVEVAEITCTAEILHQNDIWGLVALKYHLTNVLPFIELNDDPNIPPLVPVGINGGFATTLNYINDDWVLLGDLPEGDFTGRPVTQNGYIVGIVVGMNRINTEQAIMVGNRALKEFCDQVTLINAPVLEIK